MCCSIFIFTVLLPYWAKGNIYVFNKLDKTGYCQSFIESSPGSLVKFVVCGSDMHQKDWERRPRFSDKFNPFKICIRETSNCVGIDENGKVRLLTANEDDNLNGSLMWNLRDDKQLSNQNDGQCLLVDYSDDGNGYFSMVDCAVARNKQPDGFLFDIPEK